MIEGIRLGYLSHYAGPPGVDNVLRVQLYRSPHRDFWARVVCNLGSATSYTVVLPLIVWTGHVWAGVHFCFLLCMGLYLTDILKDTFSLPRPPSPPVAKPVGSTEQNFMLEYGMPSTHSCLAAIVAWYWTYMAVVSGASLWAVVGVALCGMLYVAAVGVGRVYLGMHFPGDVAAGLVCALVVIVSWTGALRVAVTWAMTPDETSPGCLVVPLVVLTAHVLVVFHPTPKDACPCFLDSVRFVWTNVGSILGGRASVVTPPRTFMDMAVRLMVGGLLVALTKTFAGPIAERLLRIALPPLAKGFGMLRHSSRILRGLGVGIASVSGIILGKWPLSGGGLELSTTPQPASLEDGGDGSATSDTSLPSNDMWSLWNHGHWKEHEVLSKCAAYCLVGLVVLYIAPLVFHQLEV